MKSKRRRASKEVHGSFRENERDPDNFGRLFVDLVECSTKVLNVLHGKIYYNLFLYDWKQDLSVKLLKKRDEKCRAHRCACRVCNFGPC